MNKCCDHSCDEGRSCPQREPYEAGITWIAICAGIALALGVFAFIDLQRPCPLFLPIACH